jgi:hypothetical protein
MRVYQPDSVTVYQLRSTKNNRKTKRKKAKRKTTARPQQPHARIQYSW